MKRIKQSSALHRGKRGRLIASGGVATLVVGALGAGAAYAYFAASSGSADATGTVAGIPVVTTAEVTPTGTVLYPGGTGGFTITVQPSTFPVRITDIVQDPARHVLVSHAAGTNCQDTSVTLIDQHHLTLDVDNTGAVTRTFANAVAMSSTASNDCQGATFAIPVVLTGRSR